MKKKIGNINNKYRLIDNKETTVNNNRLKEIDNNYNNYNNKINNLCNVYEIKIDKILKIKINNI